MPYFQFIVAFRNHEKTIASLTLRSTSSAASVSAHGDDLGLVLDVVEELEGALKLHALDGLGGLTGGLEADTEVRAPGAGALRGRNLLSGVTDLKDKKIPTSATCTDSTGRD